LQQITDYTEQELIHSLKGGDEAAFEYLYNRYSKAVLMHIMQILSNEELANDTLQEVFILIWRKISMYDASKGRLFTWMINVARNASIDVLRSKSFKNNRQNQELESNVHINTINTVSNINVDGIGLKKFVDMLREEYRIVLQLSYFQGFTHEEIAEQLQIPLGTVKTRIRAALIQLRKTMVEN
jgi:RNA polymerase sigma factor (sigma-70 family)